MANEILAIFMPGPIEILVVLIVFGIPVFIVVWIIRSLVRNKRENQRLRLEVGKLADELEKIRRQNESE